MLQALVRTVTEILDSKKAAYSFLAAIGASFLHLYYGVSIEDALLLMSPLGLATAAQAHVDAAAAKAGSTAAAGAPASDPAPAAPAAPVAAATATTPKDGSEAKDVKTDG